MPLGIRLPFVQIRIAVKFGSRPMELPTPRFTVRGMMVFVAFVGLAIGGPIEIVRLRRLSEGYMIKARRIASRERQVRSGATISHEAWVTQVQNIERSERAMGGWFKMGRPYSPEDSRRLIPYFETLRLKYERAARFPWLPLAPDPPKPETRMTPSVVSGEVSMRLKGRMLSRNEISGDDRHDPGRSGHINPRLHPDF